MYVYVHIYAIYVYIVYSVCVYTHTHTETHIYVYIYNFHQRVTKLESPGEARPCTFSKKLASDSERQWPELNLFSMIS